MPSKNVLPIDDLTFEREVLGSSVPFLLDVTATWCGPCRALAPIIERIADAHAGALRVGKLDLDEAPATAARLGVRSAPTVIVFRGGREVARRVGLTTREKLLELLELEPPPATAAAAPARA
jgi:thioredoxin 1